ncbi:MAG: PRC-barrel domain protein [Firmicutes bacterium ADurb.Bin456]|nr:MAG: PRC-barrel domain protein [Firmicutes bacterium ADurb.Bin456]
MRLGELMGKEIVNMYNGARLGVVGESDLAFDLDTGEIRQIIVPRKNGFLNFWLDRQHLIIPWEAVRKVGAEVIVIELDQTSPGYRKYST